MPHHVTLLRRTLVVIALMFWQGGFTFYTSVVVPVGGDVLGSHVEQGMITRRVTRHLNLAGTVALLPLVWDSARTRSLRKTRVLLCAGMAGLLVGLVLLHPRVDAFVDIKAVRVIDRPQFRTLHRLYLWLSTGQWLLATLFVPASLWAWRRDDR